MQEKSIQTWGHEVFYKEFGDKKNQSILILHGWWGSSDSWIKFSELLEENYHIIIPDLPGFWKTKIHETFTLEKYAESVEEMIWELGVTDIILWWHSNGWAIASMISGRKKIVIKKLVLNNSAGIRNDRRRWLKRKVLGVFSPLRHIPWYKIFRPYFHKLIGAQDYSKAEEDPYLAKTYQNMIASDLQEIFPQITDETLLIWGSEDSYTPLSDGKKMHELLQKSDLIVLQGQRHGIHLQDPKLLKNYFIKNI